MANGDSVQKRLNKVRPPRVQMTYDVDIGEATEHKELPQVNKSGSSFNRKHHFEHLRRRKGVGTVVAASPEVLFRRNCRHR